MTTDQRWGAWTMRKYVVGAVLLLTVVGGTAWTAAFAVPGESSPPCSGENGQAAVHNKHCEASGHEPGGKDREDATGGYWDRPAPAFRDADSDQVADEADNCPTVWNPHQRDHDGDGVGDRCELKDVDGDGIPDGADNCRTIANLEQADSDGDGLGDACEPGDVDGDGVPDDHDNCPTTPNPDQANSDAEREDGAAAQGDACTSDDDGDHAPDAADDRRTDHQSPGNRVDETLEAGQGVIETVRDLADVGP